MFVVVITSENVVPTGTTTSFLRSPYTVRAAFSGVQGTH